MMQAAPMSEAEWLACEAAEPILARLTRKLSERKLRLFAAACARQLLPRNRCPDLALAALTVLEEFADGACTPTLPDAKREYAESLRRGLTALGAGRRPRVLGPEAIVSVPLGPNPLACAYAAARMLVLEMGGRLTANGAHPQRRDLGDFTAGGPTPWVEGPAGALAADLLRDLAGNPFRAVAIDPAWLTSTVVAMSRGMYESREFSAMPILADALQDAGCDNDDVLNHCREPGPHVRGCWVVDLVLGKV
jgi:hypothetical protein